MQKPGVWADVGLVCMWTATARLPRGREEQLVPPQHTWVHLPGSWELKGFASAENLPLSTYVTGLCRS